MPRPAIKIKKILEGKVSLYLRENHPYWQCGFKLNNHKIRRSTKTANFSEAVEIATEEYLTARIRAKEGFTVATRTFKAIADITIKNLNAEATEDGKSGNANYVRSIEQYLIPFFGSRNIDRIDKKAIAEFRTWRNEKFGGVPSRTTVNFQVIGLNAVFKTAVDHGYMNKSQIPDFPNDGTKVTKRSDFTLDEYRILYRYMRGWVKNLGKFAKNKEVRKEQREILREYVLFLANTGVRPGTETQGLKWKQIRIDRRAEGEYILVSVTGKTGNRELTARHAIQRPLQRLAERHKEFEGLTFEQVLAKRSDSYVFAYRNGKEVDSLLSLFKDLLKEVGLRIDPRTEKERTFYSLRHMFITQALMRGMPTAIIADHCGTGLQMLQDHYNHVTALAASKAIAGKRYLTQSPNATSTQT